MRVTMEQIENKKRELEEKNSRYRYDSPDSIERKNIRDGLEALSKIDKYESIIVSKKKELPKEIKEKINANINRIYSYKIGEKTVPAIQSFMQYSDGDYHDIRVFFRGDDADYDTEFIAYLDLKSDEKHIMYAPIINENVKFGDFENIWNITINPNSTKEMTISFQKKFLFHIDSLSDLLTDKKRLTHILSFIPSVIANSLVEQNEKVEIKILPEKEFGKYLHDDMEEKGLSQTKIPSSNQDDLSNPLLPPKPYSFGGKKGEGLMYHYVVNDYSLGQIRQMVSEIKKMYPNVDIIIETFEEPFYKYSNVIPEHNQRYIISSSANIDDMDNIVSYGYLENRELIDKVEYKKLTTVIETEYVLQFIQNDILPHIEDDVMRKPCTYLYDEQKVLTEHRFRFDIPYDVENGDMCNQVVFYQTEPNVLSYLTKGQTFVRYKCNEKGEFTEEYPYVENRQDSLSPQNSDEKNNKTGENEYMSQIDSLTKQNQYLMQQNALLMEEIKKLQQQLSNQDDMDKGKGSK